tara:strand:+ start:839 stop:2146 length:1308 start_codon:yes stop_codon:yes gene_type:complete
MENGLILKGQTITFLDDPFFVDPDAAFSFDTNGAVWLEDGRIKEIGVANDILAKASGVPVIDYGRSLISAGFVDCHVHYPQLPIIASYGEQLLEWLERYTFPCESAFGNQKYARKIADLFIQECLRNGTTTASVFASVHPQSVDAFFEAATKLGLRMACGKVMMDRNAPKGLLDTAETSYELSKALLQKWHKKGRNTYVITPRFAPTSSPEQLRAAGVLWREYPDTLMQTHLSENFDEIKLVQELFPEQQDYLAVYESYDLLGHGAIFGHAIHLSQRELDAIRTSGSAVAHCPTSNMFIGSGLFNLEALKSEPQRTTVGLASDVGGGSSLSMFSTMRAAYKTAQLRGQSLHPAKLWYLATVGSAKAMRLDECIGNLKPGIEADLVVLDLKSTPIIERRIQHANDIWDVLFAQIILADDRAIEATYSGGELVYKRG